MARWNKIPISFRKWDLRMQKYGSSAPPGHAYITQQARALRDWTREQERARRTQIRMQERAYRSQIREQEKANRQLLRYQKALERAKEKESKDTDIADKLSHAEELNSSLADYIKAQREGLISIKTTKYLFITLNLTDARLDAIIKKMKAEISSFL